VLELLARHAPLSHDLVDPETFAVTRPLDVLQGAVTPCLRQDWTRLPDGTCALALGDAHSAVDPIVAQGANSGSWSAFVVGEEIVNAVDEGRGFGEDLCDRVAARRADYLAAMYDWIATMLAPPTPQLVAVTVGMAMNKAVCDEFTDNFSFPDRQWAALESMDATRAHLARFGLDADAILASLPPPN
jgi:2-polyprenyl-6-methoxyphenol hydroxylase-like FAD-dependent oxidoreductase